MKRVTQQPASETHLMLSVRHDGKYLFRTTVYYQDAPARNLEIFDQARRTILELIEQPESAVSTADISALRKQYLELSDQQDAYHTRMLNTRNKAYRQLFDGERNLFDAGRRQAEERKQELFAAVANRQQTPVG